MKDWCENNNGELIVQWECMWDEKLVRKYDTPCLPRILRPFENRTPQHIGELVMSGQLFGFVRCDIKSPEWFIEKYGSLNFPPIIRQEKVTLDMQSPYMRERLAELGRKFPSKGIPCVVNAFHAEGIFLFTPLLKEEV